MRSRWNRSDRAGKFPDFFVDKYIRQFHFPHLMIERRTIKQKPSIHAALWFGKKSAKKPRIELKELPEDKMRRIMEILSEDD